jgi:thiol-disulfide isomerase/thioredoxin
VAAKPGTFFMKISRFLTTLQVALGLVLPPLAQAAAPAPSAASANNVDPELAPVFARIKAKLDAGPTDEAGLAPELAEFDALLAKHQGEKSVLVSHVLYSKGIIYAQILRDAEKGTPLLRQVMADYPGSDAAWRAERILAAMETQAKAASDQAKLAPKAPAPGEKPTIALSDLAADKDLAAIFGRIKAKLETGQAPSEAYLAPELAELDSLLAAHHGEKTEVVSHILFSKAIIYAQVLKDTEKGFRLLRQVKTDYPNSEGARNAERLITNLETQAKASAVQAALIGKPAPTLKFLWISRAGPATLADLKGKVVVLDFWTTWNRRQFDLFPQIAELAAHYRDCAVEVVGITSLQGRIENLASKPIDCRGNPAKELGLLPVFMSSKNMTWTVAATEEDVFNPAFGVAGIPFMAIIAPDGTVRHLALNPAMPLADKARLIDAILAEFKLKLPGKA